MILKRRRGSTLLELLIVLAVMSIISLIAVTSLRSYTTFKINYTNKICSKEIVMFIHRARNYCYINSAEGIIQINKSMNKLIFITKGKDDEYSLKEKALQDSTFSGHKMNIDRSGNLRNMGTIIYKDEKNKDHKITVHVGSGYVDEKE